jgi:lipid-binding SYLF domain-containing protein
MTQVIPRNVLENAKGFAIFTIFKAGFLFSARAGSGIVIAKLDDGSECWIESQSALLF